jgi:putative transposase
MTYDEFVDLQFAHQSSGLTLKSYLKQIGTSYSTYNYWRKKFCASGDSGMRDLAPITFRPGPSSARSFRYDVPPGISLLFPNGLQAHFGAGSEEVLMELLDKSLDSHVLP